MPSTLILKYPFRVRAVDIDGRSFIVDHLTVDLTDSDCGLEIPRVRVDAPGVTEHQRAYLEQAAEAAAVQAFVQVAVQVAMQVAAPDTKYPDATPAWK